MYELYVNTLLNMDLVYNYFVRHGVQKYMRSMNGYFVRDVFVKYREVWEILRLNIVNTWNYSCC